MAYKRAKEILLYSDSEPNELLIGLLHAVILPFAMLEIGEPFIVFQILASISGFFQLYAVLIDCRLKMRVLAVKLAMLIAVSTVINYYMAGMLSGSHFGWLLILVFATWNLVRVEQERLQSGRH